MDEGIGTPSEDAPHLHQGRQFTLLYILGSGRNGSTILDLMLSGHPQILALGELCTINKFFDPFTPPSEDSITARFRPAYEEFWSRVREQVSRTSELALEHIDISHPRLRRAFSLPTNEAMAWATTNEELLTSIHAVSPRPILSDASKVPQRLYLLQRSGLFNIKVIHLIRDGRAVANSYRRRYGSFSEGMRTWVTAGIASRYLKGLFPRRDWFEMKYEELATKPRSCLSRLCDFLGVEYSDGMLEFLTHPYYGIGGNPGVKAAPTEGVALDVRWRRELGWPSRIEFALLGGWLNRMYGYPALSWERARRG